MGVRSPLAALKNMNNTRRNPELLSRGDVFQRGDESFRVERIVANPDQASAVIIRISKRGPISIDNGREGEVPQTDIQEIGRVGQNEIGVRVQNATRTGRVCLNLGPISIVRNNHI